MKTHSNPLNTKIRQCLWAGAFTLLINLPLAAQTGTVSIYSENFDSYTSYVATNFLDTTYAFPTGAAPALVVVSNNPPGGTTGSAVQLINWLSHSGGQSLLIRDGGEADINLYQVRSGSRYQLDFWLYVHKSGPTGTPGTKSWFTRPGGMGADNNADDYLAYRSDRAVGTKIFNYNGIGAGNNWVDIGATNREDTWQHHRLSVDTISRRVTIYIDDMANPIYSTNSARPDVAVPTIWRFQHEGANLNDGYYAIDDLSLTVDNGITNLATPFAEGFEGYTAGTNPAGGPWITVASDGNGNGKPLNLSKVQVVDSGAVTPHSGNKCLMLQGGQRAGVSLAWGTAPQADVQITWWAKVPAVTSSGVDAVYLRMSLYAAEGGSTYGGDCALLGYGERLQSSAIVGSPTSLLYYTTATLWADLGAHYTADTWEEYQITTANNLGTYSLVKNPSSNPQVLVSSAPFIASGKVGPTIMVGFSSSNGSGHPPVYVDDIQVKSLVGAGLPPVYNPYSVQIGGTRFTNTVALKVGGPVGAATVDPRDNSTIVYATDNGNGGCAIYRASKVAPGNWAAEPTPLVPNLAAPSGLAIQPSDGTLWWVHDFTQSLNRLRWPWSTNTPEQVIADLAGRTNDPPVGAALDDDPCDLVFPPANFSGTISATWPSSVTWPTTVNSSYLVVLDRGTDFNGNNALYLVDPATTILSRTNYDWYLYGPTTNGMGATTMVGMTTLPGTGEIVTLNQDGQVTAVNGSGGTRVFWPDLYADAHVKINPACIACDPVSGRLWIADALWQQVFSCAPDGTACQIELSFPLTNTNRSDQGLIMHSPGGGMAFAPNGSFMVFSDNSTANGGGRLLILCNEPLNSVPFNITGGSQAGQQARLAWSSAGAATYNVERRASLDGGTSFQAVATNVTTLQFTDTNAPSAGAFYRVMATPTLIP